MTKYMWSPSNLSFFPTIKVEGYVAAGWNLSDLIDIDDDVAEMYMQSPPDGKMRGVVDDMPSWVDVPPLTSDELISSANAKKSQLKAIADSEIEWRQDAVNDGSASDKEITALAAWRKYRVALMRIDTSKAPDIEWPVLPE